MFSSSTEIGYVLNLREWVGSSFGSVSGLCCIRAFVSMSVRGICLLGILL